MGTRYVAASRTLGALIAALEARGLSIESVRVLFAIAGQDGVGQGVIAKQLGISPQAVSQTTIRLCDMVMRDGTTKGLGFVNIQVDPSNLRLRLYTLTPKGKAVAKTLLEDLSKLLA